jgi:hypothetical protein
MMRRLGVVRLGLLDEGVLNGLRLKLHLLAQPLDELPLRDHHAIQLLDLMFKVRQVGLDAREPLGRIVFHVRQEPRIWLSLHLKPGSTLPPERMSVGCVSASMESAV